MNHPRTLSILALALALAPWSAAQAVRAADTPPPSPEAVRAANPPRADAVRPIREGEVTSVSEAADRVAIDGSWFHLKDGQTRVYRQGKAASAAVLVKGQRVSYSVAPSDAGTLGVVNVQ